MKTLPPPSVANRHEAFGDHQTPVSLAQRITALLQRLNTRPCSLLEPTCGVGNLLFSAMRAFPNLTRAVGVELDAEYVATAQARLSKHAAAVSSAIVQGDIFRMDWNPLFSELPDPVLILGNPPWVTNSRMGTLQGENLPKKSNYQRQRGLDAITGKSNFDISEWLLTRLMDRMNGRTGRLAMLCKTAVARKALTYAWRTAILLSAAAIYRIDAQQEFGAAVDACLLVCGFAPSSSVTECAVYPTLEAIEPERRIGYENHQLIADLPRYRQWGRLQGASGYQWRSGVKHDCSKVMELRRVENRLVNGLGENVDIEDTFLYPMLKTSEVAQRALDARRRVMLVTQRHVGEETAVIQQMAPRTWRYLQAHGAALDGRGSVIYQKRPRFSVFGVGDYSFAPWKVAISGFYKHLTFRTIGESHGKPVMLDDASYFLPCQSQEEAELLTTMLNSAPAQEFFCAFIFWDNKRPITVELLRRINMVALARELGLEDCLLKYPRWSSLTSWDSHGAQNQAFQIPLL